MGKPRIFTCSDSDDESEFVDSNKEAVQRSIEKHLHPSKHRQKSTKVGSCRQFPSKTLLCKSQLLLDEFPKSAVVTYTECMGGALSEKEKAPITHCMKGVFRKRPTDPTYSSIRDVRMVLRYLKSLRRRSTTSKNVNSHTLCNVTWDLRIYLQSSVNVQVSGQRRAVSICTTWRKGCHQLHSAPSVQIKNDGLRTAFCKNFVDEIPKHGHRIIGALYNAPHATAR